MSIYGYLTSHSYNLSVTGAINKGAMIQLRPELERNIVYNEIKSAKSPIYVACLGHEFQKGKHKRNI